MTELESQPCAAEAGRAFTPGGALLRAAPRLPSRRAALLVVGFCGAWVALQLAFGLPLCMLTAVVAMAMPLSTDTLRTCEVVTAPTGVATTGGSVLGALAAVVLLSRWGGPTLTAMGLRREGTWAREIVLGMALGPIAFALVLALELAFGWASVTPGSISPGGLLLGTFGFTGVAVNEEVATRGFLLQVLGRAWNPPVALLVSSGLFAALHGFNPNATPEAVAFLIGAGLALAWGYFATGRLWLPIAFHWSWNFAQGPLFGFPVSGLPGDGVLAVTPTAADWATGGAFGPEAGLVGLAAEAVVATVIFGWWRARGSAAATAAAGIGALASLVFLLLVAR